MAAVVIGVFGSVIGSFLNVVVYRIPRGLSVVSPPSACPGCRNRISARDNIPLFSWLALRGRCRNCKTAISARYPLVELGTALAFAGVALLFVPRLFVAPSPGALIAGILALVAFLYLAAISISLALIDLETSRLPNRIVLPAYPIGLVLLGTASILGGTLDHLLTAGIGAVALFTLYCLLSMVSRGGMGLGDVKLAGVLGLFLGWLGIPHLIVGALVAFLLGGVFGVILLLLRRVGRRSSIPFGPWMIVGAWVGVCAGQILWSGYLALFGLLS